MPTTANTINYFVAADGTLRDGPQGSISQQPRINYGTDYVVTLSFPPSTIAEGDQLQVALNRTRTFFSSASATGDAPVAAVAKHDVTAEEAAAQEVVVVLSTNTRAMIDQVNGIDHPVRGFFGVHILRGQSFVTLAVADALMMSLESGPDAISPSLPVVDYPTREEAEALAERSESAAERAEEAAAGIVPPLQLSSPPTTSTSGSVGQLAVYHDATTSKDHLYHLCFVSEGESATLYHWEECVLVSQGNVAGGYPVLDNNKKVLSANLPVGTSDSFGAYKVNSTYGVNVLGSGHLRSVRANNTEINAKSNQYHVITPDNLDYAVRSVLPNVTEIPAATSDYSLVDSSATTNNHSHVYSHSPTAVPTYRLPQVTNTTIAHYIELTVDFTAVQTYSFLDYQGEPIVPLFTPAIAAGDVYTFKMEYSAIKAAWLIYPQKQGAVADDFVMRGEVGAANGVAGLDVNAYVPREQLPIATITNMGVVRSIGARGTTIVDGAMSIYPASGNDINVRENQYKPITPAKLNYAVTAAITDANHITLNDEQKATAQSVFGIGGPITAIPAATSAYTLAEGIFTHAPTSAPTYTLPNITDDIRTHEVVLIIDFSSVQTFSFLVDGGGDVTFQSYANPTTGDVWAFRCWWYGGKWRICPMKIKNCVTRQLANGSLAITDAVGGDALSLKMVASRSVVVNQHINTTDTSVILTSGRTWLTYIGGVSAKVTGEGQSVACTGGTDMAVDLIQYFNGDSTLIDSITSWDDLVAYDPRFASYVEYNTGTVTGVQPSVHVTGKNLFDIDKFFQREASPYINKGTNNEILLTSYSINSGIKLKDMFPSLKVGQKITTSAVVNFISGTASQVATVQIRTSGGSLVANLTNIYSSAPSAGTTLSVHATVTVTQAMLDNNIWFYGAQGTIDVRVTNLQVELGSTATTYEPYHDGGTAQAPSELFAVGNAADEYKAVSGVTEKVFKQIDLSTLTWTAGDGTYSATITDIKPSTLNFLLPNGYVGSVSGTTLTITASATPTGTMVYEKATKSTTDVTPVQIDLQSGSNTAMQTDGGRLAPIDITYESNEI